jgi:hypothetical protein
MRSDPILKKLAIASIFSLLIFLHLPIFELETRQTILLLNAAVIIGCSFPFFFSLNGWSRITELIVIVFFWILCVYIHSIFHPPVTEYARGKFPYFIFIIVIGLIIIPFVVERYNIWLQFLTALIIFSIFMAVVSFFPSVNSTNARYSVIELSPTMLGKIVVIPILAFLFYRGNSWKIRYFLAASSLLGIVACVNTGSRTPIVAVLITYLVYLLINPDLKKYAKSTVALLLFFAVFMLYLGVADPEVAQRFNLDAFTVEEQSDEGDRLYVWQLAVQSIASNSGGLGFGNFSSIFWLNAPHNIWLEAIVELGFWVSLPLFVLTAIGLRSAIKLLRHEDKFATFIASLFFFNIITSLTGNELTLSAVFFYISLGMCYLYFKKLEVREDHTKSSLVKRRRRRSAVNYQQPTSG